MIGINGGSRKADAFCHELRVNPFWPLGKKQHSGQIQFSIAGSQIQIVQQAQLFNMRIREIAAISLFQKIPEQQFVQFVDSCF